MWIQRTCEQSSRVNYPKFFMRNRFSLISRSVISTEFTRFPEQLPCGTIRSEINAVLHRRGFSPIRPFDRGAFFSSLSWSSEGDSVAREKPNPPFSWERQYLSTVLETDEVRLGVRVKTLEATLFMRLLDLTGAPQDQEESKAVEEALCNLAVLKQERGIA